MGEPRRPDRVAEAIREEVATFLAERVKDPRIRSFVTVTAVEVTRDLRHATVYVSLMGDEADRRKTMEGLGSVASFLRSHLGRTLRLRSAPDVHFRADESVARASRIEQLLSQIRDERGPEPLAEPSDTSAGEPSAEPASDASPTDA